MTCIDCGQPATGHTCDDCRERIATRPDTTTPAYWYEQGYEAGLTAYEGQDEAMVAYGLAHYRRRGKLRDGHYERGIADGIEAMIAGNEWSNAA